MAGSSPQPTIADLFHRRWAVPIFDHLERNRGAKFVTLVHTTGASPASVRQTLDHLIANRWVMPNPGYGHPLRPEYVLTPSGERLAPHCSALLRAVASESLDEIALRKWSLPTLGALAERPRRFRELANVLRGISDRALSQALARLGAVPLVAKCSAAGRPSGWSYFPAGMGAELACRVAEVGRELAAAGGVSRGGGRPVPLPNCPD